MMDTMGRVRKYNLGDTVRVSLGGVEQDGWGKITVLSYARNHTYVLHLGDSNTTIHLPEHNILEIVEAD